MQSGGTGTLRISHPKSSTPMMIQSGIKRCKSLLGWNTAAASGPNHGTVNRVLIQSTRARPDRCLHG